MYVYIYIYIALCVRLFLHLCYCPYFAELDSRDFLKTSLNPRSDHCESRVTWFQRVPDIWPISVLIL